MKDAYQLLLNVTSTPYAGIYKMHLHQESR